MRRLHVIEDFDRMGGEIYYREDKYAHNPELLEAYKCGKKDGWRDAMREAEREGHYGERHYGRVGMPPMYRDEHLMHHEPPMYRHERDWDDDDEIEYRRGRNAMGRYTRI